METKHTKGKWNISITGAFIESENKIICSIPMTSDEYLANAKMIAAAPEMLEALNDLLAFHVRYFKGSIAGAEYRKKAEQAIKKATE